MAITLRSLRVYVHCGIRAKISSSSRWSFSAYCCTFTARCIGTGINTVAYGGT